MPTIAIADETIPLDNPPSPDAGFSLCACGNHFADDDAQEIDGVDSCPRCVEDAYTCGECECLTADDCGDAHITLCADCRNAHYVACDDCNEVTRTRDTYRVCGNRVCEHCRDNNYFCCDGCGDTYPNDDYCCDGYCQGCWDDHGSDDGNCTNSPGPEIRGRTFTEIRSKRRFGVELEFSRVSGPYDVSELTKWGACPDGTSGVVQEHYSPIMAGDEGLRSVREFISYALSNEYEVSKACGYHLHIDMSRDDDIALCKLVTAYELTLPVWQSFVAPGRRNNTYCAGHYSGDPADYVKRKACPKNFSVYRYAAVNWQAYRKHQTVEIRLHSGTCNADKVCNWIKAHLRFADWATSADTETILKLDAMDTAQRFAVLAAIWDDPELTAFYRTRGDRHGWETSTPRVRPEQPTPIAPAPVDLPHELWQGSLFNVDDSDDRLHYVNEQLTYLQRLPVGDVMVRTGDYRPGSVGLFQTSCSGYLTRELPTAEFFRPIATREVGAEEQLEVGDIVVNENRPNGLQWCADYFSTPERMREQYPTVRYFRRVN